MLTSFGWGVILTILFSFWVTYKIGQRQLNAGKGGMGCLGFGYTFLVVVCVIGMSLGGVIGIGSSIYTKAKVLMNGASYTSKVVNYTSYDSYDSDSGSYTTMYTAVVEFTTNEGDVVTYSPSYSSSSKPTIGSYIKVFYDGSTNKAMDFSVGSIVLFIGSLLLMTVLLFVFFGILLFAMNYDMTNYKRIIQYVGLNIFIPVVMVLFDGLLIYAFFYGNSVPWFVSVLLGFVIVVLTLGIWGYFKMIRESDIEWVKTSTGSWSGNPVPKKPKTKREGASNARKKRANE